MHWFTVAWGSQRKRGHSFDHRRGTDVPRLCSCCASCAAAHPPHTPACCSRMHQWQPYGLARPAAAARLHTDMDGDGPRTSHNARQRIHRMCVYIAAFRTRGQRANCGALHNSPRADVLVHPASTHRAKSWSTWPRNQRHHALLTGCLRSRARPPSRGAGACCMPGAAPWWMHPTCHSQVCPLLRH